MSLGFDYKVLLLTQDGEANADGSTNASEFEEHVLAGVDSIDKVNEWFDSFDEKVAYPNEGNLQYEVGSDGLIVVIVKTHEAKTQVLEFLNSQNETPDVLPLYANSLKRHDDSNSPSPRVHGDVAAQTRPEPVANDPKLDHGLDPPQKNLPVQDRPRFFLLVMLYLIQGVPIGLAFGAVPFLLKSGQLTYSQVGVFSLASYPYSLKLLWSPIVDSCFFKKIGRRRSWIIPVQTVSGLTLLVLGTLIDNVMLNMKKNLYTLTYTFFFLILLCATQDIAVDGWALTILSKDALSYASTAQTIGLNTGYFLSFTVFLAFNSPDFANSYLRSTPSTQGVLSLGQYMSFWGWIYLLVTVLIALFVPEDPLSVDKHASPKDIELEELHRDEHTRIAGSQVHTAYSEPSGRAALISVYQKMWNVIKLKNVKLFILVHLVSKIAFQANEAATNLKLLDKGFSREDLAITVLIDFPFEIIFGYYSARWSTGDEPLKPWMYAYLGRVVAAALGQILVWSFPQSGQVTKTYFLFVIFQHLLGSFMSTIQFVSICAFHTKIADPLIGGTYMTTLNTLSNLGGQWPKIIVLSLIDKLTNAKCLPTSPMPQNPFETAPYYNCYTASLKDDCAGHGGVCTTIADGYYNTNLLCIVLGILLYYGWIRKTVLHLQSLPVAEREPGQFLDKGVEVHRRDEQHPEPEHEQQRDVHEGVVLEQRRGCLQRPGLPEPCCRLLEPGPLCLQVLQRVEPGTLEDQQHRAQRQDEHVARGVVAAVPAALDGATLGGRDAAGGIEQLVEIGAHHFELARVDGSCGRDPRALAARENEHLVHDGQPEEPLRIEDPPRGCTDVLFERLLERAGVGIAGRCRHACKQQKVHHGRPQPAFLDEQHVEDVAFGGEVVGGDFRGRRNSNQLAQQNGQWVQCGHESLELGDLELAGHDGELGVGHLEMPPHRVRVYRRRHKEEVKIFIFNMAEIAAEDLPTRWEIELEYLTYLAQTGYLEDERFLNYLRYLEYWRRPEYAKQLVYPNCLYVLTMLKSEQFRKDIAKAELSSVLYNDMVERWKEPLREQAKESTEERAPEIKQEPADLSKDPIYDHCFSQDRKTVAISRQNDVEIYDLSVAGKPRLVTVLKHHDKAVTALDISTDGKIVTCSQDRNALVWEPTPSGEYKPTLVLLRINRAATSVKWSPSGTKFAVGSSARVVAVCYFEVENDWWISKHIKKPLKSTILSLDWHENSVLLACGSTDGHVRVFSTFIKSIDAKPPSTVWGERLPFQTLCLDYNVGSWVHDVKFDPSFSFLAAVGNDSSLYVVYPGPGEQEVAGVFKATTSYLPFKTVLFASPSKVIAAGHDCHPIVFEGGPNGWQQTSAIDDPATKKTAASESQSALNMFRQLDLKGSSDAKSGHLATVHQNTINVLRPFQQNGTDVLRSPPAARAPPPCRRHGDGIGPTPLAQDLDHDARDHSNADASHRGQRLEVVPERGAVDGVPLHLQLVVDVGDLRQNVRVVWLKVSELAKVDLCLFDAALFDEPSWRLDAEDEGENKYGAGKNDLDGRWVHPLVAACLVERCAVVGEIGQHDTEIHRTGENVVARSSDGFWSTLGNVARSTNNSGTDTQTFNQPASVQLAHFVAGDLDNCSNGPNKTSQLHRSDSSQTLCSINRKKSSSDGTQLNHRRDVGFQVGELVGGL
ncbi:hypothetical protein OGAPHI_005353 [Ogataea philodendri]|uniref:Mediator of RNA polymerase II transcription subunit 31 n=1 Tax=Ogataea philodendri TaxID=1378263 RepID=A0A9P8T209_9ASCO|nr:uncharacterized protein OGAPHI_005353 [Ogataea philodendri]KAH3663363.1 hypothetical protein OGAPHI_005353 [Ogataea philodendri]